jgi:GT2 family glycosyltransferase
MESVAVLIPVFNALEYTKNAILNIKEGIKDCKWVLNTNFHIVIIDDGSTDGTSEWINTHSPDVHVCKGDGNLWWSGGINKGASYAIETLNCTYILLWNNDITSNADYFKNLEDIIEKFPKNYVFGSKILIKNTNKVWFMGGIFNPTSGKKYMIGLNQTDSEPYKKITACDWITGMGTVVHKSVIKKIGYWDEQKFPQYHGDVDFTYRATVAGYKLFIYPNLIIYNDITNTGIYHTSTLKSLKKSLTSIKSDFCLKKDLLFYKKHSKSIFAYKALFIKYFKYIGGFIKHIIWK